MENLEAIENRRSIRKYKDIDIENEVIKDILNCGRLAPSAKNRQPWYFVILKNKIKNEVATIMLEDLKQKQQKQDEEGLKDSGSVETTAKVILEAPVLILILREKDDDWEIGDNLSIGACVENMCLRATDLGLGSLWIRDTVFASELIAKHIGKSEMEVNCALSIGVPNQTPHMRPRKDLEDIMEWYI